MRARIMALICLAGLGTFGQVAWAARNSVFVINCATCVTTADFKLAAANQATIWTDSRRHSAPPVFTGTYVVSSGTVARTAIVNVTGSLYAAQCQGDTCQWILPAVGSPIKLDGTPVTSDDDLLTTEVGLFGNSRSATSLTAPITLDPAYGGSYANNDALDEDTSTGVNAAMNQRSSSYNSLLPVGTVVQVRWADGSTAWVIKNANTATYLWSIIPGSARDKDGHPIDRQGNIIGNPNTTSSGLNGAPADIGSFGSWNSLVSFTPDPIPQGTVTIEWPDGTSTASDIYLPPGG